MREFEGKFPRRSNRELNRPNREPQGSVLTLRSLRRRIPISSWLWAVGRLLLRPGPPRFGRFVITGRARGMRSARRSDVLWTNPRLPRPGRTAGSSGSVCTAAQPLTQNRALRKWLNIFAARRPGNNRTFSWFGRNPSGGLPGRRLGSRCTVTKVGKSDREGAFAGASGNDEDAPIADRGGLKRGRQQSTDFVEKVLEQNS